MEEHRGQTKGGLNDVPIQARESTPNPNNYTDPEGPVTVRPGCHRRRAAANPQKP